MQHLKIFKVELVDSILIVTPTGDGNLFRYQDLHLEANSIRSQLGRPDIGGLVLNLKEINYFGSEFIGALVSMLREVKMKARRGVFCEANDEMKQVLQNMNLFRLWPYYVTQGEALVSFQKQLTPSATPR